MHSRCNSFWNSIAALIKDYFQRELLLATNGKAIVFFDFVLQNTGAEVLQEVDRTGLLDMIKIQNVGRKDLHAMLD
jgi:hypothetical protein